MNRLPVHELSTVQHKLLLSSCAYLIKFGEVDIMQAGLTRQFPDTLTGSARDYTAAESRVHPYPTNSQRLSKNPLTSRAYTVEAISTAQPGGQCHSDDTQFCCRLTITLGDSAVYRPNASKTSSVVIRAEGNATRDEGPGWSGQ